MKHSQRGAASSEQLLLAGLSGQMWGKGSGPQECSGREPELSSCYRVGPEMTSELLANVSGLHIE